MMLNNRVGIIILIINQYGASVRGKVGEVPVARLEALPWVGGRLQWAIL